MRVTFLVPTSLLFPFQLNHAERSVTMTEDLKIKLFLDVIINYTDINKIKKQYYMLYMYNGLIFVHISLQKKKYL